LLISSPSVGSRDRYRVLPTSTRPDPLTRNGTRSSLVTLLLRSRLSRRQLGHSPSRRRFRSVRRRYRIGRNSYIVLQVSHSLFESFISSFLLHFYPSLSPQYSSPPDSVFDTDLIRSFHSACLTFALNLSSVWLIGAASGLVLTLAGVIKDIGLVTGSWLILGSSITSVQIFGYAVALGGLVWFKMQ